MHTQKVYGPNFVECFSESTHLGTFLKAGDILLTLSYLLLDNDAMYQIKYCSSNNPDDNDNL